MKIDLGLTDPCMHSRVNNCDTHRLAQKLSFIKQFWFIQKNKNYLNSFLLEEFIQSRVFIDEK